MTRTAAYRGQPVLVLLMLLAGWLGVRTVLWQSPFPEALAAGTVRASRAIAGTRPDAFAAATRGTPGWRFAHPVNARPMRLAAARAGLASATMPQLPPPGWAFAPAAGSGLAADASRPADPAPALSGAFPQLAGDTGRAPEQRWSGEAWLLLRRDTTTPITSGRGSYGQSQVGAVLRYRLATASGHRPAAYARASAALGARDAEIALGVTARAIPGVPVAFAAEARGARTSEGSEVRPAAFAYTELPPFELPLGARGEAYVQGGWVGGRFATGFVDAQVRVDRKVARLGPAELRAGAGVWGGAQKGAERVDVGPGATIAVELGGAPVRMSADWRFRVAGEAHPHSGPALTISTGF